MTENTLKSLEKRGVYNFLHSAFAKGYVKKGQTYAERYSGRYGLGWVIHYANIGSTYPSPSNTYHRIAYFVKRW